MTPEEFEKIFGNTPFENIQKIKEYINIHFVPYEQYVSNINEINKKWQDKIKAKIEEYKNMLKRLNKAKDIERIKAINERLIAFQEILLLEKG